MALKIDKKVIILLILALAFILRFYKIDVNPPGLYWDEAVFGYDSYSILKTAKDHNGNFLPLFFESFGDWKLPVYHYLLVPSINIFGLNSFAVRFPSAIFGTFTVLALFGVVKILTKKTSLASLAALFLAISPWHNQFSRGGFEATAGLFFLTTGLYAFLLAKNSKKYWLLLISLLSFTLSMYSYHAFRIFTPLFLIALIIIFRDFFKANLKKVLFPAIIALILLIPLIIFSFSPNGRARAMSQSIFSAANYENERINYDQNSKKPLRFLSKYWFLPLYYSYQSLDNYLSHFSPTFLFFQGDQTGRHSQVDMGQIYLFDGMLILIALFFIKKLKNNAIKIIMVWLLLSPIPAMIVNPSPHAYRTLQLVIPLTILSAAGAYFIFKSRAHYIFKLAVVGIVIYYFASYLHLLHTHYPRKFAADWQDGYRQMVEQIQIFQEDYEKIYITDINQVPYIYLLFYQAYEPNKYILEGGSKESFGKYVFIPRDVNVYDKGRILYVAPSWEKVDGKWLAAADDSNLRHIYSLWEINGEN